MVTRTRWGVAVVAALLLSACQPNRFVSGWIPYWNASSGVGAVNDPNAVSLYSEVSLMWYGTAADGSVPLMASATTLANTVATLRSRGLPVIPTVFDQTASGVMRAILHDPDRRGRHEDNLVNLVTSKGYDGIDIDYEVFAFGADRAYWSTITPDWVAFVRELGNKLHANGKLLSVTVPPVWTSTTGAAIGYTVYAQDRIAPFVDRLRLMVYDWSVTYPGAIAPTFWVNNVVAYSSTVVPPAKLQLGVPAYGRHWTTQRYSAQICPDGALKKPDSITMRETAALATAAKVTPVRDSSGELTFSWEVKVTGPRVAPVPAPPYLPTAAGTSVLVNPADNAGGLQPAQRLAPPSGNVTCTVKHTVFVPDATTIASRAQAVLAKGWSGIVMWAMGYETADVYQQLGSMAAQRPNGTPVVQLDTPVKGTGSIRLKGGAWHPEWDLPVAVRITLAPSGAAPTVTRTVTANVSRSGVPAGLGPFHGFDQTFSGLATGTTYQLCAIALAWGGAATGSTVCTTATAG